MLLIRVAAIPSQGAVSEKIFESVPLSGFSKRIRQKILRRYRVFLLDSVKSQRAVKEAAQMIAELKMANPGTDFHFVGRTE